MSHCLCSPIICCIMTQSDQIEKIPHITGNQRPPVSPGFIVISCKPERILLRLQLARHRREFSISKNLLRILARSREILFYFSPPSRNSRFQKANFQSRLEQRDYKNLDLVIYIYIYTLELNSHQSTIAFHGGFVCTYQH